jgi:hypothetical protein
MASSILVAPILVGLVAAGATMLVLQALGGDVRGVARAVVSRSH